MSNNTEQRYSLSHPQKRIWYTEKLNPGTAIHHICGIGEIQGEVNIELLSQTIQIIMSRHQVFRLIMIEDEHGPVQLMSEKPLSIPGFTDFSSMTDPQASFNSWLNMQLHQPLEVDQQVLYRFELYKIGAEHYGIFAKLHHLIFDGWSTTLLTTEICRYYEELATKDNHTIEFNLEIPNLTLEDRDYTDLLIREQQYALSSRFSTDQTYWNKKFATIPAPVFLTDTYSLKARKLTYNLSDTTALSIREWTQSQHCSLNDYFVLLMSLYIYKMYDHKEMVIGLPVYNRSDIADKQTIGMFTSTMPIICSVEPTDHPLDMLKQLKREIRSSFIHQKYPFDMLIQDLQLKSRGYDSLFQIAVNYYPFVPAERLLDHPFQVKEVHSGQQQLPLQLIIKEWDQQKLSLELDYHVDLFSEYEMQLMMERLCFLSDQIVKYPQIQVRDLSVLTDSEQQMLFTFNDTTEKYPAELNIIQLFELQVNHNPNQIAVSMGDISCSYKQLYNYVCDIVGRLARLDVCAGNRVGVYGTHGIEMVAGILAILKIGATYVPIDPDYPVQRINDIVEDSSISCIILNQTLPQAMIYSGNWLQLEQLSTIELIESEYKKSFLDPANVMTTTEDLKLDQPQPDDLAYIIYTSGSTGKPKGVMIRHKNLTNYCCWANQVYIQRQPSVFALYSSLAFDLTVTSLFTPLIGGHEIRIYKESESDFVLFDIVRDNRATVLKLTPAHLALLREQDLTDSQLETLIVGGENLKTSIASEVYQQFKKPINIYNEYGPTEATVGCMSYRYNPEQDSGISVPIGKPAANVQLYVLNQQLKTVPVGSIGELFIGGAGIAKGYWNRDQLTATAFVANPFQAGEHIYRTGDLVSFNAAYQLEYKGRKDRQVKINGYRIELEEIEATLLQHEQVDQAVVLERKVPIQALSEIQTNEQESQMLCAYVVLKNSTEIQQVQAYISAKLPVYMVPKQIVMIDHIPLTVNGKVDINALPMPIMKVGTKAVLSAELSDYSIEQETLLDIVKSLLHREDVQLNQDFFELGGDSIKAIQLSSRLKTAGYVLKAREVLTYSKLLDMASHIVKDQIATGLTSYTLAEGILKPSPVHEWFWSQKLSQPEYYHQSILLKLDDSITKKMIEAGLHTIVLHHDALRLNLNQQQKLYYNPQHIEQMLTVQFYDLSDLSYIEQCTMIQQTGEQLKSSYDLHSDLLIQGIYYELGNQGKRLLLTAHHLVIDGVSWRIILEDLAQCWIMQKEGNEIVLPAKTHSYQQWTEALEMYQKQNNSKNLYYWENIYKKIQYTDTYINQTESSFQKTNMSESVYLTAQLDQVWTSRWLLEANTAYQTQPLELLIVALVCALKETLDQSAVLFELEGHGREEFSRTVDISRTVGWFTSIFPVSVQLPSTHLSEQIKAVKEQLRQVPDKGFTYLINRYLQPTLEALPPEHMIRLNYLGDFDGFEVENVFELAEEWAGADIGTNNAFAVNMDIYAMVKKEQLCLNLTFSNQKYNLQKMERLIQNWHDQLIMIIEHCSKQHIAVYTPSDFETISLDQEELDSLFAD
ncbi:amino acid adenylation domain-containing protein [Paenibacillus nicotianae]|uniref:Amino acid adenylation domain-containing protein n=1 Tax=Paenibacillus nicotianae TaxID=1526551 RepID=A0ABW4UUA4_9BACL